MNVVLIGLALFFILGTVLPLLSHDRWVIRIFDFPRAQISIMGILIAGTYPLFWDTSSLLEDGVLLGLWISAAYQCYRMYPYTPLAARQVLDAEEDHPDARFSLLIANVCITNRDADPMRALVEHVNPDLVLALEPDTWWEEQLQSVEASYPHVVKHVIDNAYGMILYSRLPLIHPEVRFMVEDDVPSVHTQVELPSGDRFYLHGMHPRPPHPTHDPDTTERDAEMLMLGHEIEGREGATVVGGDLNDVSWSYTTELFQKISGLLDPRVGRGTYSTFHAEYLIFRYPLDHLFHSDHFKLVRLERLPYIGSDHFPVLVELQYEDGAPHEQDAPEADQTARRQAQEEIEKLEEKKAQEVEWGQR
jgi:endonuclease/exonuclease/phosphatase (EEP) superfamily protein YafD